MKQLKRALMALLVFIAIPALASAQDGPKAGEATGETGGSGVIYKKKTEYDFEGDDVDGALVKPNETSITGEQHGKTSSLIDIRADFINEMIKTVEEI